MTLAVHLFLIALDRIHTAESHETGCPTSRLCDVGCSQPILRLLPCLAFAAVLALNVLTKGLIGLVFPLAFVFLYLALTRQLQLLPKLHLISSTAVFLAIAAPWHILAALRNPAIPLPSGLGLPAKGGWAWFYLYNEHIARFLSKRIPHDYGQTPIWLFWLLVLIWVMPWAAFLPAALSATHPCAASAMLAATAREHEAALSLILWTVIVLGFFTLSARQEYYSLPALPALALMAGGVLARADNQTSDPATSRSALRWSLFFLVPLTIPLAVICGYFAISAPHPPPGTDLATLLATNPDLYNLSLGHLYDLTGAAMGLFRGPLTAVALSMIAIGLGAYLLRRRDHTYAANLTLAAGMIVTLLAAHEGLVRFNPILGSKDLALAINHAQASVSHSRTTSSSSTANSPPAPPSSSTPASRSTSSTAASTASGTAASGPTPPHLRDRDLPPPALVRPPPHLPPHLQPHRAHTRPRPLRPSPHPRLRRRQNHPHQPLTTSIVTALSLASLTARS